MTDPSLFNTANLVDYGMIGLYFAIIIWVGVYAAGKNKSTDDFFKGGGKVPWLVAGLSNWVSGFSAFMFVAAAGFTYMYGAGAILIFTSAFWAYLVGYWFFAARWRRARINSPLEFLTRRFSASTTYYYSITAVIPQIVGIGQGLYILCIFVATALGFSDQVFAFAGISITGFQLSIIVTGVVMMVYTVIGGLWAAVLSDAVQSIIIVTMTIVIFPVSFSYLGQGHGIYAGLQRLINEAPPGYLGLTGDLANPFFLFSYFLNVMIGYNVSWALVQRYHSVPDERDARKMSMLCAVLSLVGPLLWILPVMASRIIFPDMQALWPSFAVPAEASFVSLALLLLPHGLIGFVISAILSATLGQANDAFNWLTATLTRDIYVPLQKRLMGRDPSDQRQLLVARAMMFVVGVLGILVALLIPKAGGAFAFALEYYSLTAAFSMPVVLGMIFTRTPWWSGIASCSAAIVVALVLMLAGVWNEHAFARNMISASVVASVVFFGSAFFFRKGDAHNEHVLALERDLRQPVLASAERFDPSGFHVYRLLGWVCLVLGGVLTVCLAVPSGPVSPSWINLIVGVFLLLLGAVILYASRERSTRAVPLMSEKL
jgi:solute:Na+ symporter, SSS family